MEGNVLSSETTVNVQINAILLNVDESIQRVAPPPGYTIHKQRHNDFLHFSDTVNGVGRLDTCYFSSRLIGQNGCDEIISFIVISREDSFLVQSPELKTGLVITDTPFCESQLVAYKEAEFKKLNDFLSRLQLYKAGDVGLYEIFFDFKFCFIANSHIKKNIIIKDANTVGMNRYHLSDGELSDWDAFLASNVNSFDVIRPIINEFTYSQKLIDPSTRLEQLTTAMEMMFLDRGQQGKKQVLSKRTATFIGINDANVAQLYADMLNYYRYRSESTHEGIDANITTATVLALEEIARKSINKYLARIEAILNSNPASTYEQIKSDLITELISDVSTHIANGILPT